MHNLGLIDFEPGAEPADWAVEFDAFAGKAIAAGDHRALISCKGKAAALSAPTPDHYWPFLYALGLQEEDERPDPIVAGIAHSTISMRAFRLG